MELKDFVSNTLVQIVECVNFNIAISTSASGNLDGKAKIIVVNAELGGTISRENISRVSFPVYVQWPRKS